MNTCPEETDEIVFSWLPLHPGWRRNDDLDQVTGMSLDRCAVVDTIYEDRSTNTDNPRDEPSAKRGVDEPPGSGRDK